MWSWWAMRTEAVAVIYWGLGGKVLLDYLRGTPFLPWVLRLFGAKMRQGRLDGLHRHHRVRLRQGRRLLRTINAQSALQTHLYEDRVMKVGRVETWQGRLTVGAGSTVLYDTHVGDFRPAGAC